MDGKHIIYRDSNKIIALVIVWLFVFLFFLSDALGPYVSTRYPEAVIRFFGILGMIASIGRIVCLIQSVKNGYEYIVFDLDGIREKGREKILWKDIIRIEEMCDRRNGLALEIYYKGQKGEMMEKISFDTVKGDIKQIWEMIQEYWEKYR